MWNRQEQYDEGRCQCQPTNASPDDTDGRNQNSDAQGGEGANKLAPQQGLIKRTGSAASGTATPAPRASRV